MTYNQQLLGRVVVPASGEEDDYEPDDIPKLWQCKQTRGDRWLRTRCAACITCVCVCVLVFQKGR